MNVLHSEPKLEASSSSNEVDVDGNEHGDHIEDKELQGRKLERIDGWTDRYRDPKSNLLHNTLNEKDKIWDMKVYRDLTTNEVLLTCKMGNGISGHPGIVHGGATAALLDNTFGYAYIVTNVGNGFTANLNINYRAPIIAGSKIILIARAMKIEGRKVHLSAEIRSRDKDDYDKIYVEAECLFITSNKLKQIEKAT